MSGLPFVDTAKSAAETASGRVKGLVPWLPSPHECDCGALCEATRVYDPDQAAFYPETNGKVPAWECPECGAAYRREENDGYTFSPWK